MSVNIQEINLKKQSAIMLLKITFYLLINKIPFFLQLS